MDRRLDQARLSEIARVEQRLDRLVLRFETTLRDHAACQLRALGRTDQRRGLGGIDAERLLDKHVSSGPDGGKCCVMMSAARGADNDGVDIGTGQHGVGGCKCRNGFAIDACGDLLRRAAGDSGQNGLVERPDRPRVRFTDRPWTDQPDAKLAHLTSSMLGRKGLTGDIDGLGNDGPIVAETKSKQIRWRADCQRWKLERCARIDRCQPERLGQRQAGHASGRRDPEREAGCCARQKRRADDFEPAVRLQFDASAHGMS